jgi:hypothetical protein
MSGGQEILTSSRGSAAVRSRWERDCLAVFEAIVRRGGRWVDEMGMIRGGAVNGRWRR